MPYSSIARDAGYIGRLQAFLRDRYALDITAITPAKRGFYGETWQVDTPNNRYFAKLDYSGHQVIYARSFPFIEYLNGCGIDFISKIVKSAHGELCTHFDGAVLGLFEWIDGENIETDDTKIPEYAMLAKVYTVSGEGLDIPREDFSVACISRFYSQWARLAAMPADALAARICAVFDGHRAELDRLAQRLEGFSARCAGDASGFFITHGDAGGNLIQNGRQYYLIDWDAPMLSPPERDAWVMCARAWARDAFTFALRNAGIDYALRPERLAYYCYHLFFFYLTEYLDGYTREGIADEIERYFDGWIMERVRYADTIALA